MISVFWCAVSKDHLLHISLTVELQKNSLNPSVDSVSALSAFGKHPLFLKPPQSVLHLKVSELSELAQYL